jgi:hypothetical protein
MPGRRSFHDLRRAWRPSGLTIADAPAAMLYSPTRRFLFIHIQKTGGTSLAAVLLKEAPDAAQHEFTARVHGSAMWALEALGPAAFADAFRFAFVRNPYDRLLSWYSMIEQMPLERCTPLQRSVRLNCATFEEFVLHGPQRVLTDIADVFVRNQADYLSDRRGNLLVEFVGRFERFAQDAATVMQRIGVQAELPHINPSRHAHYRDAFSTRMRAAVRWRFRRDFAAFGYRF